MTLMMSGNVQEYDDNPKKMMILNKDIRSQKKTRDFQCDRLTKYTKLMNEEKYIIIKEKQRHNLSDS